MILKAKAAPSRPGVRRPGRCSKPDKILSGVFPPIALVFCALLATGCPAGNNGEDAPRSRRGGAVVVDTAVAADERVEVTVRSVGSGKSVEEAEICAEVAGKITAIGFDEGQAVAAGDLLVRIDDERARLGVNQVRARQETLVVSVRRAAAEVGRARAFLANAEETYERKKTLLEKKAETRSVFLDAKAAWEQAVAEHEAALAARDEVLASLEEAGDALAIAEKTMRDHAISAPFDGVLGERLVSPGDFLDVGDCVVVAYTTDPIHIEFTVPERHRESVKPDQDVEAVLEALPGRPFRGRVAFISPALDPSTRTVKVKALFENAAGALKPGYFCRVRLIVSVDDESPVIPEEAIVPRENALYVYVVDEGKAVMTRVEKGERLTGRVQILEGIAAGDEVIVGGHQKVSDGIPVQPRGAADSPAGTGTLPADEGGE